MSDGTGVARSVQQPTGGAVTEESLLRVDDLRAGYGRAEIVRSVGFDVARGSIVSIVGSNGAGKSTLFASIVGVLSLWSGSIAWRGIRLPRPSPQQLAKMGLVYVMEGNRTFANMTVYENLVLGAVALGRKPKASTMAQVYALFPVLANRSGQPAGNLSGGEKKMLALGRAMMAEPEMLMMDEPTSGLAPGMISIIGDALCTLASGGLTILLAEQGLQLPESLGGQAYLLERGQFTWFGPCTQLADVPEVRRAVVGFDQ